MSNFQIRIAALIITLTALTGYNLAFASTKGDITKQIHTDNEAFVKMLNAKSDPEDLMKFLHERINNDAKITMKINNPEIKDAGTMEMKLTKADYINSYIYGPRQVQNYHADMKVLDIKIDAKSNAVTTKEVLTESGTMLDPHNFEHEGRPFTSHTSCESKHSVEDNGNITLIDATCHTEILYEESV